MKILVNAKKTDPSIRDQGNDYVTVPYMVVDTSSPIAAFHVLWNIYTKGDEGMEMAKRLAAVLIEHPGLQGTGPLQEVLGIDGEEMRSKYASSWDQASGTQIIGCEESLSVSVK